MPLISFKTSKKRRRLERQKEKRRDREVGTDYGNKTPCNLVTRVLEIHFFQSFMVYTELCHSRRVGMGFTSLLYNAHLMSCLQVQ